MEILLGVLASASFLEKVSLLVVGAALTGIIVPVVKFRMDQTRFEQQKILTEFVDGWLIHELDMTVQRRRRGDSANWSQFNRWLYAESRIRTDSLLVILASDFGLASANVAQAASSRANQLKTQDARSRPASAT
jgi:hypothetical protein